MNQDISKGYVVPLPAKPRDTKLSVLIAAAGLLLAFLIGELEPGAADTETKTLRMLWPLFVLILLYELLRCWAKLRIFPQGITITWGRWTMNGMLAERIVLLAGVFCNSHYYLAVCPRTVEELAEIQAVEMPAMYQNSRTKPGWTEEMASMYLRKQGRSLFRHTQPILWLEWSPERLEMLQTMYPHAQWLDTTSDKRLEARLAGNPSRKS